MYLVSGRWLSYAQSVEYEVNWRDAKRSLLSLQICAIFRLHHAPMRKDTRLSLLFHTASDRKLGGAWEQGKLVNMPYKQNNANPAFLNGGFTNWKKGQKKSLDPQRGENDVTIILYTKPFVTLEPVPLSHPPHNEAGIHVCLKCHCCYNDLKPFQSTD